MTPSRRLPTGHGVMDTPGLSPIGGGRGGGDGDGDGDGAGMAMSPFEPPSPAMAHEHLTPMSASPFSPAALHASPERASPHRLSLLDSPLHGSGDDAGATSLAAAVQALHHHSGSHSGGSSGSGTRDGLDRDHNRSGSSRRSSSSLSHPSIAELDTLGVHSSLHASFDMSDSSGGTTGASRGDARAGSASDDGATAPSLPPSPPGLDTPVRHRSRTSSHLASPGADGDSRVRRSLFQSPGPARAASVEEEAAAVAAGIAAAHACAGAPSVATTPGPAATRHALSASMLSGVSSDSRGASVAAGAPSKGDDSDSDDLAYSLSTSGGEQSLNAAGRRNDRNSPDGGAGAGNGRGGSGAGRGSMRAPPTTTTGAAEGTGTSSHSNGNGNSNGNGGGQRDTHLAHTAPATPPSSRSRPLGAAQAGHHHRAAADTSSSQSRTSQTSVDRLAMMSQVDMASASLSGGSSLSHSQRAEDASSSAHSAGGGYSQMSLRTLSALTDLPDTPPAPAPAHGHIPSPWPSPVPVAHHPWSSERPNAPTPRPSFLEGESVPGTTGRKRVHFADGRFGAGSVRSPAGAGVPFSHRSTGGGAGAAGGLADVAARLPFADMGRPDGTPAAEPWYHRRNVADVTVGSAKDAATTAATTAAVHTPVVGKKLRLEEFQTGPGERCVLLCVLCGSGRVAWGLAPSSHSI